MGGGFPAFAGASGRGSRNKEDNFGRNRSSANSASYPNRSPSPFKNYQDNSIIVEGELQSPNGMGIS